MDTLAAFRVFIRVVETGSFSAAARRERIGQPAASKAIAQLEEWVGVPLLLRSTRHLAPTEAGLNFLARARRTIEEADEALLAARGGDGGVSGRLRVSASVCFARLHIVPRLTAFLERHPDLEVELILDDRKIDLIDEGIDVALRMGALPDSSMTAKKIAQARRLVIATPSYFARHGTPLSPADLIEHKAVIYTRDGGGESWVFSRDGVDCAANIAGRVRVSASEGQRAAILSDMGLTIASEWSFTPELASGAVVSVMDDWALPHINLAAVFPSGRLVSRKAREFVAFVETCVAPEKIGAASHALE